MGFDEISYLLEVGGIAVEVNLVNVRADSGRYEWCGVW